MKSFKYELSHSYEMNFRRWYELNTIERLEFRDIPLSRDIAVNAFNKMYRQHHIGREGYWEDYPV